MYDENILSDLHKDAYGYRPCEGYYEYWNSLNEKGKNSEWNSLCELLKMNERREELEKNRSIVILSATINDVMDTCKTSWSNAVKILMDAEDADDVGYFLWNNGICSTQYEYQFIKLMKGI